MESDKRNEPECVGHIPAYCIGYQEIVLLPQTGFERFIAKGTQAFQLTIFM